MRIFCIAFFFLPTCFLSTAQQQATGTFELRLGENIEDTSFTSLVGVWIDTLGTLDVAHIHEMADTLFRPYTDSLAARAGQHPIWVKITFINLTNRQQDWVIRDMAGNDMVDLYLQDEAGSWTHRLSGRFVPGRERAINRYHFIAFELTLRPGERRQVYLRFKNIAGGSPYLRLRLQRKFLWLQINMEDALVAIGSFIAIMFMMFLYSMMVFLATWERMYLYYGLYILCVAVFVLTAGGPHQPKFHPILNQYLLIISTCGISVFYFQFGRKFLNLADILPRWDRILQYYIVLRLVTLVGILLWMGFTFRLSPGYIIEFAFFLVDAALSVGLFVPLIRKKSKVGWFFIAGSAVVFVLALSYLTLAIFINDGNLNTPYVFAAFLLEILIFAMGLGYRIKQMEKEKLQAKEEQLAAQQALIEEQRKINTAFGRFVPEEFLKALDYKGILDVKLGHAKEKEVTVFFSDIRDYTSLAEEMSPEENFRFLNSYLGRVGPIIKQHGGFVNQYYGDGIMALFMENPADAVRAGIAMHHALRAYNEERKAKGRKAIRIGIGIHTGKLMMGIIGDTLRLEAGVVSDTVNTASRTEGLTKYYGAAILVSEYSLRKIEYPGQFHFRYLGLVQVKGRKSPMRIYEFYDAEPEMIVELRLKTQQDFERGITAYYAQQFEAAAEAFRRVLKINPTDKAALLYLEKATRFQRKGVPQGWNGVETMLSK